MKRPPEAEAEAAIHAYLERIYGHAPEFHMVPDGDEGVRGQTCGWAFWIFWNDTTSYAHYSDSEFEDDGRIRIEWYGSTYPDEPEW